MRIVFALILASVFVHGDEVVSEGHYTGNHVRHVRSIGAGQYLGIIKKVIKDEGSKIIRIISADISKESAVLLGEVVIPWVVSGIFFAQTLTWDNARPGSLSPLVVPDWYHPRVSEHMFDPYSLIHVVHGYLFYTLFGQDNQAVGFTRAVGLATEWELIENSDIVIARYRNISGTSRNYSGDSLINSLGDVISMSSGYWIAAISESIDMGWIPVGLTVTSEVGLLFYMRDNLLLTVVTMFLPIDTIAKWQEQGIPGHSG